MGLLWCDEFHLYSNDNILYITTLLQELKFMLGTQLSKFATL